MNILPYILLNDMNMNMNMDIETTNATHATKAYFRHNVIDRITKIINDLGWIIYDRGDHFVGGQLFIIKTKKMPQVTIELTLMKFKSSYGLISVEPRSNLLSGPNTIKLFTALNNSAIDVTFYY